MKKLVLLLFVTLIAGGCDSPLSDVELNDPGVLTVRAWLKRGTSHGLLTEHQIRLRITDKNNASVELLDGEVLVNELAMDFSGILIGYELNEWQTMVAADSVYVFDIVLSDSAHYPSSITSQPNLLEFTEFPTSMILGDDLTFGWNGEGQADPLEIRLTVSAGNQDRTHTFLMGNLSQTEYIISAVYFLDPPAADQAQVMLVSERSTNGHPDFSESELTCTFSCARGLTILPAD